ncbi:MAG: alpha/beta hydrolase [Kosmotoga sp.]|nr:MAG: alpha/beta hydrolase [Kosmotoga sp.]
MPKIVMRDSKKIYYEIYGDEQKPVLIVLNGIMMSTLSWKDFIGEFTKFFRLVLVDFRDQGQSDYMEEQYDIKIHSDDLNELVMKLGFSKINILGLSYGGQVAEIFAIQHPEKVQSIVLANTVGRINSYLSELGEAWKEAADTKDGEKFFKLAIPFIYSDHFYNNNLEWLKNRQKIFKKLLTEKWFEGFKRLASSNPDFNVIDEVHMIKAPTLLLASDKDIITPIEEVDELHNRIPDNEYIIIKNAGHASVLEKPKEFITAVTGFVLKNN